jgi:thioredoxin-related protein
MARLSLAFIFSILLTPTTTRAQKWETDFERASEIALREKKFILLVFQGSDWCGPCMKLDRDIWRSESFINQYPKTFVLLKADFPKRKKNALSKTQQEKNKRLAANYNPEGFFPLVLVLDAKGNALGKLGYAKTSPQEYLKQLTHFTE